MNNTYFLYISILIVAASFSYIAENGNDLSLRVSARFLVFLSMLLPAMLRYNIGIDYGNYAYIYENNFTIGQEMEPGFRLLGLLLKKINISPWLYMGIISGITYGFICFIIPRKYIFTVILFYILSFNYLNSYNNVRQLLASSFLFCGFSYYYHNNKLKGWIYFIISVLIHYSCLIVFPIIFFSHIKINRYFRSFLMLVIVLTFIFTDFFTLIINIAILINARYSHYLDLVNEKQKTINTGLSFIIFALPSILLLSNSKNIEKQSNGNFLLNINAVYIITISMAYITAAFTRLYNVMAFSSIFSIQILYDSNKKYRIINYYLLLITFLALFVRYMGARPGAGVVPYNSIFNK